MESNVIKAQRLRIILARNITIPSFTFTDPDNVEFQTQITDKNYATDKKNEKTSIGTRIRAPQTTKLHVQSKR